MSTKLSFVTRCCLHASLAVILAAFGGIQRLAAQGTTATILGTVTDSTGAAIPDAAVQVKNAGTGQTQSIQSDAQGRYRVADLAVGDYEVTASKAGFSTLLHKGITLTVGSQSVVDFSLAVGQTQQTVTVEGQVTQVETTNAVVSTLVSQAQMRDLPLNGRNFESLIQSAPGVQNYYAGTTGLNMREGRDASISVAGGRPEGIALLMDDQTLENFYNRGLGSITGSSLGVDAIGEFQTLTNTYGAQFGGSGAVMNAVSKSGTNSFHGSAYEFLRNSALDARNFTDLASPGNPNGATPAFRRNQYGGTLGGPVKKDKVFFFVNYEGVRFTQGFSQIVTVPSNPACPATCRLASTAANPQTAAAVNAVLALYPLPQFNFNTISPTVGTGQTTVVAAQTAHENYVLGRGDYNISDKDSFFGRYFIDLQDAIYPFSGSNLALEPEVENGANQFVTVEERHIFSPTVVNVLRGSFSRTNSNSSAGLIHDALQMYPGSNRPDASISMGNGTTGIGTGGASPEPEYQIQNRYSEGDDLSWSHGAHSLRFGASVDRVQSGVYWPFQGQSVWSFPNIAAFLAGTGTTLTGVPNIPQNYPIRDYREIDYVFYGQDDWKVTSKLSVNLGLRYAPMSNPVERSNNLFTVVNFLTDSSFTNVPHVMQTNPSLKNFDPRVGFAYDPFKDHKTSIRGGFGMFHEVLSPGVWGIGFINSPPWRIISQTSPSGTTAVTFQNPSIAGGAAPFSIGAPGAPSLPSTTTGYAWQLNRTPYMIQYNFNIQREIMQGTVLTVGYVGSHGVNLITGVQENPTGFNIDSAGVYHFNGVRRNAALGSSTLGVNGTNSRYNSLQASVNRRLSHNVQAQASYTYSKCLGTGDATLGSLSGNSPTTFSNPYDRQPDYSVCGYNVTQALRLNSLVALPFHGNRLVEGWQVTGILAASTGLPFNVSNGADQSNQLGATSRPDYAPNNPAATFNGISYPACNNSPYIRTVALWFNPNCFNQPAFGTLGNFAREGLYGPGLVNVDLGILKTTKIREGTTLQFRAEFFNALNHTNLSYPASAIFSGTPAFSATSPLGAPLSRVSTAGQITTYASPSREIQFGLKLIF
jgi:hypothetical protein